MKKSVSRRKPTPKGNKTLPISTRTRARGKTTGASWTKLKEREMKKAKTDGATGTGVAGVPVKTAKQIQGRPAPFIPENVEAVMAVVKPETAISHSKVVLALMKNSEKYVALKAEAGELVVRAGMFLDSADEGDQTALAIAQRGVRVVRDVQLLGHAVEELRKSVSVPLLTAKKEVDQLFKDVMDDVGEREEAVRSRLLDVAKELKQTTKFPGVGVLVVGCKPAVVILDEEDVPGEYKKVVLDDAKIADDIAAGVTLIPGLLITDNWSIEVRGDFASESSRGLEDLAGSFTEEFDAR